MTCSFLNHSLTAEKCAPAPSCINSDLLLAANIHESRKHQQDCGFLWIRHHMADWTVINWTTATWGCGLHLSGFRPHQAKHCTDERRRQWREQRILLCRDASLVAAVLNHIHNSHVFLQKKSLLWKNFCCYWINWNLHWTQDHSS